MAKPAYDVVVIDLTAAKTRARIVDAGQKVDSVSVVSLGAGVSLSLVFGENNKEIPVSNGDSFDLSSLDSEGCPVPLDEGVFETHPVGAGSAQILISFGSIERTSAA